MKGFQSSDLSTIIKSIDHLVVLEKSRNFHRQPRPIEAGEKLHRTIDEHSAAERQHARILPSTNIHLKLQSPRRIYPSHHPNRHPDHHPDHRLYHHLNRQYIEESHCRMLLYV